MAACVVRCSQPFRRSEKRGLFGLRFLDVGEATDPDELSIVFADSHAFDFHTLSLLHGSNSLGEKLYLLVHHTAIDRIHTKLRNHVTPS